MIEIVLGCNPEKRASSTRETGCLKRISSRTMSRLMSRAFSLEASCAEERSIRLTPCTLSAAANRFVQEATPLFSFENSCYAIELLAGSHPRQRSGKDQPRNIG